VLVAPSAIQIIAGKRLKLAKYLVIEMPDGSEWEVPVQPIVQDRAKYYAELDSRKNGTPYLERYNEELEFSLNDDAEAIDWAKNNMNWSDVQSLAVKVKEPPPVDFQEGWCNGDSYIYDKPTV
jgi:hypothetical protein